MAGIKRKDAPKAAAAPATKPSKKQKITPVKSGKPTKKPLPVAADLPESDTTEDSDDLDIPPQSGAEESEASMSDEDEDEEPKAKKNADKEATDGEKKIKTGTTSAEAHAEQRRLAKERKAAKPNADLIARSKKIWERLRRKSHVPLEERKELVTELFDIITGRVRDFVFKHDSVRVIQCALKYANKEQKAMIASELQADIRPLSESKYGKFLVGKMIVEGDQTTRDMIVPEFYGHVRRLINHPEASWIVDDIYRQVASPEQKALMLREWYGAEFAVFAKTKAARPNNTSVDEKPTADLAAVLAASPEKKKPILQYLHQMINALVQKKLTGFTMLHDAMLQYFLALAPGTPEATEFLELLKSDLETEDKDSTNTGGDLLKNLAFTRSGSRVVCLALAYGSAKDRKIILRVYRDTVEMMAFDVHAHNVLLAAMDVVDDTKMSAKALFPELLGESISDSTEREDRLVGLVNDQQARKALLYPLASNAKWLLDDREQELLKEVHAIRETTSKKNPDIRRKELVAAYSTPLLGLIENHAQDLASTSFGAQFVAEALLEGSGDKSAACSAVAALAGGDPTAQEHIAHNAAAGRMLRSLASGGKFDPETKTVKLVEPALGFAQVLYEQIKAHLVDWATGPSSFVVVSLLESGDFEEKKKDEVKKVLKKEKKRLEKAAAGEGDKKESAEKGKKKKGGTKGNAGAKILLEKIGK